MAISDKFNQFYQPSNSKVWKGLRQSQGQAYYYQAINTIDIRKDIMVSDDCVNYGLLGFCCDSGVIRNQGRPGAKEGPKALRQALANLPIHFADTVRLYDCGDVVDKTQDLEAAQQALAEAVARLKALNLKPILIGGGHEIAWGHYQGLLNAHSLEQFGIINFDAHYDMRQLLKGNKGSSGTPFLQIAKDCEKRQCPFDYTCIGIQTHANTQELFDTAKRHHVYTLLADDIYMQDPAHSVAMMDDTLNRLDQIYLTVCLDVFSAPIAPGVSAPQVAGLQAWQVIRLLRYIARSKKVVSFDIAELSPPHDKDQQTAKLAALLVANYINFSS